MKKRFISRFWAVMTALALSMTVFNAGILTALAGVSLAVSAIFDIAMKSRG
jgi:hypothetical protein